VRRDGSEFSGGTRQSRELVHRTHQCLRLHQRHQLSASGGGATARNRQTLSIAHMTLSSSATSRRSRNCLEQRRRALYGWSASEAIAAMGELIFAESNDRETLLEQLVSAGEFHGEIKHRAKDGREVIVNSRVTSFETTTAHRTRCSESTRTSLSKKKLEMHLLPRAAAGKYRHTGQWGGA